MYSVFEACWEYHVRCGELQRLGKPAVVKLQAEDVQGACCEPQHTASSGGLCDPAPCFGSDLSQLCGRPFCDRPSCGPCCPRRTTQCCRRGCALCWRTSPFWTPTTSQVRSSTLIFKHSPPIVCGDHPLQNPFGTATRGPVRFWVWVSLQPRAPASGPSFWSSVWSLCQWPAAEEMLASRFSILPRGV